MTTSAPRGWQFARLAAWVVGIAASASLVVPAILQRDTLQREVQTLWYEHSHALASTVNAAALAEQIEYMISMDADLAASLPDAAGEDALLKQIRAEAAAAELQVESLEIAPRRAHEFYGDRAVRLVAIGPTQGAHAMLATVLSAPPLRRIDTVSLERTKRESLTLVRLELDFQAYDYNPE